MMTFAFIKNVQAKNDETKLELEKTDGRLTESTSAESVTNMFSESIFYDYANKKHKVMHSRRELAFW